MASYANVMKGPTVAKKVARPPAQKKKLAEAVLKQLAEKADVDKVDRIGAVGGGTVMRRKPARPLDSSIVVQGLNESRYQFQKQFFLSEWDYGAEALNAWEDEGNGFPSLLHAAVDYRNVGASGPDKWIVMQLLNMGADVNRRPTGPSRLAFMNNYNPMETCACALGTALGIDPLFTKDFRPGYVDNYLIVIGILRESGGKHAFSIDCLWTKYYAATQVRLNWDETDVDITNTMNRFMEDPMFLEAFGLSPSQLEGQLQRQHPLHARA